MNEQDKAQLLSAAVYYLKTDDIIEYLANNAGLPEIIDNALNEAQKRVRKGKSETEFVVLRVVDSEYAISKALGTVSVTDPATTPVENVDGLGKTVERPADDPEVIDVTGEEVQ